MIEQIGRKKCQKFFFEIIEVVGFAIVEADHRLFEFDGCDNEKYAQALSTSIDAITISTEVFVGQSMNKCWLWRYELTL